MDILLLYLSVNGQHLVGDANGEVAHRRRQVRHSGRPDVPGAGRELQKGITQFCVPEAGSDRAGHLRLIWLK
jgi:hypothetical protein